MSVDVTDEYRNTEPKWCAIHNGWFYRCFELSADVDEWNKCLEEHDTKVVMKFKESVYF